ncbi:MAG: thermostable hemolysin [Mariprofundaceae bacterium]|nr:thermostable hemolysin [Mariprofundaceae bacterium]
MIIEALEVDHPGRGETEQFIHDRFDLEYDANLHHYMPHLVRLSTREGELVAAVGYRDAACHDLFVEHYFDEPIEVVMSRELGRKLARHDIVEVGNLADAHPGGARAAITALTAYLYGAGFRWVVFTGVIKLRNAFFRLGIDTVHIGDADPARLNTEEQKSWGRYYLAGPRIMAGDIHEGYWALEFSRTVLQPLWMGALAEGMQQGKKRKGV